MKFSFPIVRPRVLSIGLMAAGLSQFVGCAKEPSLNPATQCATEIAETGAGPDGAAFVFYPDPIARSENPNLSPASLQLDHYRTEVQLKRLGGRGVLEGAYVDVRSGQCSEGFGAQSSENRFLYSHKEPGFQEAMSYFFGDQYREALDRAGVLAPVAPVKVIAHCMQQDNAYFVRGRDQSGQMVEKVCLGDSVATLGASYADDAMVALHELQHATTLDTYSMQHELSEFWYDEAGAVNEAVSDFMSMAFLEPLIPGSLDPRVFSRWALGTFFQGRSGIRGAHKCPVYDSAYPECSNFKSDLTGFSVANQMNTLSYVYPDGLGWPYANNYSAPGYLRSAFLSFRGQEEIHNTATIVTGALWDVYESLKAGHVQEDSDRVFQLASKLVMKAVMHLPKPDLENRSPVTFRNFGSALVNAAALLELNSRDQDAIAASLTARGLLGGASLPAGWAASPEPDEALDVKIKDNPLDLKTWLRNMGVESAGQPSAVNQGPGTTNGRLEPGETVALWFNIQNKAEPTAGGLMLTVTSTDPNVTFLDENYNFGYLEPSRAQIMYGKVNGTGIVSALYSPNAAFHVPTGNTYFLTHPYYDRSWTTALWIKAREGVRAGDQVKFRVKIAPSNGPVETVVFKVKIH